jgi:hypothetical protein
MQANSIRGDALLAMASKTNKPVVREQLQDGVRLARILDTAFGN